MGTITGVPSSMKIFSSVWLYPHARWNSASPILASARSLPSFMASEKAGWSSFHLYRVATAISKYWASCSSVNPNKHSLVTSSQYSALYLDGRPIFFLAVPMIREYHYWPFLIHHRMNRV